MNTQLNSRNMTVTGKYNLCKAKNLNAFLTVKTSIKWRFSVWKRFQKSPIIKEIIENMYKSSFFENVDLLNSEKEETKYQHW